MEKYKRINDDEVFKTLDAIKNEDEQSIKKTLETLIFLSLDIRHFLRKIYKDSPKKLNHIVTDPLIAKKNDIVIGKDKK